MWYCTGQVGLLVLVLYNMWPGSRIEGMTASFLQYGEWLTLSLPPPDWLVDGLIERGAGGFIHGAPGVFKSFFLLQLGLDVAAGASPLGVWKADVPKAVVLLQAEGTRRGWRDRIRAHEAVYPRVLDFFSLHRLDLKADSRVGTRLIETALAEIRPALVIIDPLANWMTGSDTDDTAIDKWHGLWNSWRENFGSAVLIGHHDRQPLRSYDKAAGAMTVKDYGPEEMRGHTRLYAWADFQAALKKKDGVSTLTVEKVRERVAGDEYRFRLENGRLVLVGRSDTVETWIAEHLKDGPLVSEVVREATKATGMSTKTVRRHLDLMIGSGQAAKFLDPEGKTRLRKGGP